MAYQEEAQTFTLSTSYELYNIQFYGSEGATPGSVMVSVTSTVNGFPNTSDILGQQQTSLPIGYYTLVVVNFASPILLTAGVTYAIDLKNLDPIYTPDSVCVYSNTVDNYVGGQLIVRSGSDNSWVTASSYVGIFSQNAPQGNYYQYWDMVFANYGLPQSSPTSTPTPTPYNGNNYPTPTPIYNPNPTPTPYYGIPTPTPYIIPGTPTPAPQTVYIMGYGFSDRDFLIIVLASAVIAGCSVYVGWSINNSKRKSRRR